MQVSLFSQSLFALSLEEAIEVTSSVGFPAIELACTEPHLDMLRAHRSAEAVAERIGAAGLAVSALSLFSSFTDPASLDQQVAAAEFYVRLAPLFGTGIVKLTPGPPGSASAQPAHWECLGAAIARLAPVAAECGVRLAFETHMRQLTDTLASSQRLMSMTGSEVVGLTVDFSNLAFAGDDPTRAITDLGDSIYNTHLKNGSVGRGGAWQFGPLDEGLTDYTAVLATLRDAGYDGYLTVECLGPDAQEMPAATARRDLEILRRYLDQLRRLPAGKERGRQ